MITSNSSRSDIGPEIQDLMHRVDDGYFPTDDELTRLKAHDRCPHCGRLPEAEPGFKECDDTGFHTTTVDDAGPDDDPPPPVQEVARDYPDPLKDYPQWVNWDAVAADDGRVRKVPKQTSTGHNAAVDDSRTFGTFGPAVDAVDAGTHDGAGFVLTGTDSFVFLDFDDAIDPDERARFQAIGITDPFAGVKPWAESVLKQIQPYAYIGLSQSGKGIHAILDGKLPGKGGKRPVIRDDVEVGKFEIYDRGRFVALTGMKVWSGILVPAQTIVDQVWGHFGFGGYGEGAGIGTGPYDGDVWSTGLSDDDVLTKSRNGKYGDEFAALYDRGDTSDYNGDQSRADAALVRKIAWWTGPCPEQIDRLFRPSTLYRSKWDEDRGSSTYGELTIGNVLRDLGADRSAYYGSRRTAKSPGDSGQTSSGSSGSSGISGDQNESGQISEPPRFPVDILPPVTRAFVEQGAKAIGVPVEMVAVPFFVNAAAAIGNTRRIELKPGYEQSPILFMATVAKPGSAKTPSSDYARAPLDTLQEEAHRVFKVLYQEYEIALKQSKKSKVASVPDLPIQEQFYTTNATTEAVASLLEYTPGLAVISDELIGWFNALDAYRKGGDKQFYLSAWAGSRIKVDRKTALPIFIPHPALSVFGTIQPDLLSTLADEANRQDGFIDRWLMVNPDAGYAKWNEETIRRKPIDDMTKVFRRLRNPKGYTGAATLPLTPDARSVFRDWYAENGTIAEASDGLAAGWAAKLPNQCARLALILHLLAKPDDLKGPIEAETVRDAITLAEYFRASLARILPLFKAKASNQSAGLIPRVRRILEKAKGEWVDRTTLNTALGGYVMSADITTALEALKDQGLTECQTVPSGPTGGRPKEQWRFVFGFSEDSPEEPEEPEKPTSSDGESAAESPNLDSETDDIIDLSKMRRRS